MRVLVTGAGGFIGRRLVPTIAKSHDVTCISSRAPSLAGVRWIRSDDLLGIGSDYDALVHLAGNSNHAAPIEADLAATVGFSARVLGATNATRLVVLSSAAVYAGLEGQTDPGSCLDPTMPYALAKLHSEGIARFFRQEERFESLVILRLYNAFGPGERETRLIPRIAAAARTSEAFTLTGDPSSLSDPVHVDDVARTLTVAAESSVEGVFDLCGGEPLALGERVRQIAAILGHPDLEVRELPRPGEVVIRFYGDPGKLATSLDVECPEPFHVAASRYAREAGWLSA